jgi:hypothetical protein
MLLSCIACISAHLTYPITFQNVKVSSIFQNGRRCSCWWYWCCRSQYCGSPRLSRETRGYCSEPHGLSLLGLNNYYPTDSGKTVETKGKNMGVRLITTDYKDVATLTQILQVNNVHTVISALNMMPNAAGPMETNLIWAADASRTTKRLVPSEYGFPQHEE